MVSNEYSADKRAGIKPAQYLSVERQCNTSNLIEAQIFHPDSVFIFIQKKKTLATKKPPVKGPGANVLEQSAFSPNVSQELVGPPILNEKSAVCPAYGTSSPDTS